MIRSPSALSPTPGRVINARAEGPKSHSGLATLPELEPRLLRLQHSLVRPANQTAQQTVQISIVAMLLNMRLPHLLRPNKPPNPCLRKSILWKGPRTITLVQHRWLKATGSANSNHPTMSRHIHETAHQPLDLSIFFVPIEYHRKQRLIPSVSVTEHRLHLKERRNLWQPKIR